MKIGDYVRTNIGTIFKVDKDEIHALEENKKWNLQYGDNAYIEAVKSSSNIIDLIEVGDYVNGEPIIDIRNDDNINNEKLLYYYIPSDYAEDCFREKDIKSIVTKKQFESMEYKVVENND